MKEGVIGELEQAGFILSTNHIQMTYKVPVVAIGQLGVLFL